MRRALVLAGWVAAAVAQAASLDAVPACQQALAALDARAAELHGASAPAADANWLALRRAAARACLGADAEAAPPPRRTLQAPIEVHAPMVLRAPVTPAPHAGPVTPTPAPTPPISLSACDPTGCWTSAGTRLPRVGTQLLSPRGLCSVQGSLVVCP
jgi:hypothetical protein